MVGRNYDCHVSFTKEQTHQGQVDYNFGTITTDPRYVNEELPGVSGFAAGEGGEVFLTYATFARGLDMLLTTDHYLDLTPEGRNANAYPAWPRRFDEYPGCRRLTCTSVSNRNTPSSVNASLDSPSPGQGSYATQGGKGVHGIAGIESMRGWV